MRCIFLFAAAPLLLGAAPSWKNQALSSAAPFIDKANQEWSRAIAVGNADVLAAPYDAKGVFIGPDGNEVRGKDAVRTMYSKRRADVKVLQAAITSDGRVAADPDDVYEWGKATMTIERDGKIKQTSGRYLTVWHRQGRAWLISHNIAF